MPAGEVTLVKGEAILSELAWVRHKRGMAGLEQVFSDLNCERPENLRVSMGDFDKRKWYPVETQHNILRSIVERFGNGDSSIAEEVGAHGVRKIGQFAIVLRFMNVRTVTEKRGDNIMVLYRTLELRPSYPDDNTIHIKVRGFPVDRIYCHLLIGGIREMMRVIKLKDAVVDEPQCRTRGDEYCMFRIRYGT